MLHRASEILVAAHGSVVDSQRLIKLYTDSWYTMDMMGTDKHYDTLSVFANGDTAADMR